MKKKLMSVIMAALLSLSVMACGNTADKQQANATKTSAAQATSKAVSAAVPDKDRAGNPIKIPAKVDKIVALAPSIVQEIVDLGLKDKLVVIDSYSAMIYPDLAGKKQMDMMAPNIETLVAEKPDLVLSTNLTAAGGKDPLDALKKADICVAQIPTANSLADIALDVQFIADAVGQHEKGAELVKNFEDAISKFKETAKKSDKPKKVLFELEAGPHFSTPGKNTYINELLQLIALENVFGDQEGWVSYSDEQAVAKNPDIIFTTVNYVDDIINKILARPAWTGVNAVQNKQVFYVDNNSVSTPNHHVVDALNDMAKIAWPELYK